MHVTTCNYLFEKSSNKSRAKGFSLPHFLPVIKQEEEGEGEKGGTRTDFVQRPSVVKTGLETFLKLKKTLMRNLFREIWSETDVSLL